MTLLYPLESLMAHPPRLSPAYRSTVKPLQHRCQRRLCLDTIKPGQVADPDGKPQAPHLVLAVFARSMLVHLYTRIYFNGDVANAADPVLALVPADRRSGPIATRKASTGNAVYSLDIDLQGVNETAFFEI